MSEEETVFDNPGTVRWYRTPMGWGVSGPPDLVKIGPVEVTDREGVVSTVHIYTLSEIRYTREGVAWRIGYREEVILNGDELSRDITKLLEGIKKWQMTGEKLCKKLETLQLEIKKWSKDP